MPIKGQFTAGVCVFFDRTLEIEPVATAIEAGGFSVLKRIPAGEHWQFHGPSLKVSYRPEVNGFAAVDVVPRPWPDEMGDPQSDPMTFGAWSMGYFGPFAYPGGLRRAAQQTWSWPDGKSIPNRQTGFIRILVSYVFGAEPNAPIIPEDYEPIGELEYALWVAASVAKLPGAIAFFNPNGEVLRAPDTIEEQLVWSTNHQVPPLDLLANVRLFNVDPGWSVMDTVGNSQFDHLKLSKPFPDLEALVPKKGVNLQEVDPFLRNTTTYLLRNWERFGDGDTINGPGGNWRGLIRERGLLNPPRSTLRFVPTWTQPPDLLTARNEHPLG